MAKGDKTRQSELSIEQEKALDILLTGATDKETSEAVGVARQTVTTWRNQNPAFIAELNRRRAALWQANLDKLRGLVGEAVMVLADDIRQDCDYRLRQAAAVHILKATGLYSADHAPGGPTTAAAVETEQQKQAQLEMFDSLTWGGPALLP